MKRTLLVLRNHIRGRLLLGLAIFAPFAVTIYVLLWFVQLSKRLMTGPLIAFVKNQLEDKPDWVQEIVRNPRTQELVWWVEYPMFALSLLIALFLLYLVGLVPATFLGRRYIAAGESLIFRIPGMDFVYKTIKQVIEIVSRPRSQAFKKVVIIDYPRDGTRGFAFYSGLTRIENQNRFLVNVFIPTTPNPTSGFLLLVKPEEVWETNLKITDATRFIISGGVVELEGLEVFPFDLEKNLLEQKQEQRAIVEAEAPA